MLFLMLLSINVYSQGLNHNWLIGYNFSASSPKGRILIDSSSITVLSEQRKMPFVGAAQSNISDENGNFLMSTNGVWIADATNDTMMNGDSLNPNSFTSAWSDGLPIPNGNLFLPMPDDSNKYVLFHQTGNISSINNPLGLTTEIYYSIIDITQNSGLGEVISKNNVALIGLFGGGMAACKHGNGRDWWVIAMSDSGNIAYKFLLTHNAVTYMGSQNLQVPAYEGWAGQPTFSPDGSKFAYISGTPCPNPPTQYITNMRYFEFNRCIGFFSNPVVVNLPDSTFSGATAFSSNSKLLYVASVWNIYQFNTDSAYTNPYLINVAINDSFADPFPPVYAAFYLAYLGANGKIYLTTGNTTHYIHAIENPDNIGMACNVQQHSVLLPCYHGQAVPNHPNYYLGRLVGSACDTLTSVNDLTEHDFKFSLSPNPTNGSIKIVYLLPQNQKGVFEVYDVTGKKVFSYHLPQWSTLQNFDLSFLGNGVYNCTVTSNNQKVNRKLVVIR
jgi:hypothetical protein